MSSFKGLNKSFSKVVGGISFVKSITVGNLLKSCFRCSGVVMVFDLGLTSLFRRDRSECVLKLVDFSYFATNRIFSFVLGDF